jgi:putative endonuclease
MYIVYCIQHSLSLEMYIGFTTNLEQRLESHNGNRNRATKKDDGDWILVYAEAYRSEHDARVRELKLKQHGSAKHGLKKRIQASLLETKK